MTEGAVIVGNFFKPLIDNVKITDNFSINFLAIPISVFLIIGLIFLIIEGINLAFKILFVLSFTVLISFTIYFLLHGGI